MEGPQYVQRGIFRVVLEQLIMYTFGKIFMLQAKLLGHFSCDMFRVWRGFPHTPITSYPSESSMGLYGVVYWPKDAYHERSQKFGPLLY